MNPLFVGLLVAVMQTICVNCHRLRLSPHYINAVVPQSTTARNNDNRILQRLKTITALCARQMRCQFGANERVVCHSPQASVLRG